jgi:DNA-binding GntR family transcriptional regulator
MMFRSHTLSDQVYDHLLSSISSGRLPAGTPLRELDLVAQLGVSRTPIREALARLAECGLVEVLCSRTTRVRRLGLRDVTHIFAVRHTLERLAVRLACDHLTDDELRRLEALAPEPAARRTDKFVDACYEFDVELHRSIAQASGNPILEAEICKLHDLTQLVHKPVADRPHRLNREVRQHLHILDRLKARDRPGSVRALGEHLRAACRYMRRILPADQTPDRDGVETAAGS